MNRFTSIASTKHLWSVLTLLLMCIPLAEAQITHTSYLPTQGVPLLTGVSFSQGDFIGSRRPDFVLSGRLPGGAISTRLYESLGEQIITNTPPQEDQCQLFFNASPTALPQVWLGDVKLVNISGGDRDDLLVVGAQATEAPYNPTGRMFVSSSGALAPGPLLPAVYNATLAVDGELVAISGNTGSGLVLDVLRFVPGTSPRTTRLDTEVQLPGLELAALALATEMDGTLVLVASGIGDEDGVPVARHYRRAAGETAFREMPTTNLPPLYNGSAFLEDLNEDGLLDLFISGSRYGPHFIEGTTSVLFGTPNGTFQPSGLDFPQVAEPVIDVQDHNSDGHLDLLLSGLEGSPLDAVGVYYVYDGDGTGEFSLYAKGPAPYGGDGGWIDGNRRGDLEIMLAGTFGGSPVFQAYVGRRDPPPLPNFPLIGCPPYY